VPFDQISAGVNNARRVAMANSDELKKLELLTGLLAYLAVAEHVTVPHFEGLVTRTIMEMRGVSESAAHSYKRKFNETIKRELDQRSSLLHSIISELTHEPMLFVISTASAESGDNRRLLMESRKLMAEYANDCRVQELVKSAREAMIEKKRLAVEEQRLAEQAELLVQ
jgi:hypothetical protein